MTADLIRAKTPVDSDRTVTFRPVNYSSRTAEIRGTVIEHEGTDLVLGVHPDLYAIPFAQIVAVSR